MDNKLKSVSTYLKSKFSSKEPSQHLTVVAERFIQLFRDHGIEKSQIPRVFSKVSLQDLSSTSALIEKLSPTLIDEVAKLFNVRSEWLEGVDEVIYPYFSCCKQSHKLFKLMDDIEVLADDSPFRVLTTVKNLDYLSSHNQPILLVVLKKIAELNDEDIYRYHLATEWDWSHESSRIQIKAIATVFYQKYHVPIPIFQVEQKAFNKIATRLVVPTQALDQCLSTDPSLEDYILDKNQNGKAKETNELPMVKAYIEQNKLDEFAIIDNRELHQVDPCQESSHDSQSFQTKGAFAKHMPITLLKRECIEYALKHSFPSNDEAARKFYSNLPQERQKNLAPTNAVRTLSKALSEYKRRDQLQQKNKLPLWLKDFNPEI